MGMPGNVEGMRMDEFVIRKLVGMIEEVRGREKECVHKYQEESCIFSKLHHPAAKIRKKRKELKIYDQFGLWLSSEQPPSSLTPMIFSFDYYRME